MSISVQRHDGGAVEVVMDVPPVNALTVRGWFELADAIRDAGRDPVVRAVVLRAEGRGFNAGVDIKETTSGCRKWTGERSARPPTWPGSCHSS